MSRNNHNGILYKAEVDGRSFEVGQDGIDRLDSVQNGDRGYHLLSGSKSYAFQVLEAHPESKRYTFSCNGKILTVQLYNTTEMQVESLGLRANGSQHINQVEAPMPGLVLSLSVEEGQQVSAGQPLMILEAMKMENVIVSPRDGTIATIAAQPGDTVDKKQLLITFD